MTMLSLPLQNPDVSRPITDEDGSPNQQGANLIQTLINRTGGASGLPSLDTMAAAGLAQATAAQLTADINEVTPVAAASGVILVVTKPGMSQEVYNAGANSVNVYPPLDMLIDALAANAPYVLAVGKTQVFKVYSVTQIRSLQLG